MGIRFNSIASLRHFLATKGVAENRLDACIKQIGESHHTQLTDANIRGVLLEIPDSLIIGGGNQTQQAPRLGQPSSVEDTTSRSAPTTSLNTGTFGGHTSDVGDSNAPEKRDVANVINEEVSVPLADLLTAEEVHKIKSIYGSALDLREVQVRRATTLTFGGSSKTLGNTIFIVPSRLDDDGNLTQRGKKTLLHELTHVWQFQNGGVAYVVQSLKAQAIATLHTGDRRGAYDWREGMNQGKTFAELNPEQQGRVVDEAAWVLFNDAQLTPGVMRPAAPGLRSVQYTAEEVHYMQAALREVKAGHGAPSFGERIALGSFLRLKALQDKGDIEITPTGDLKIKDGSISHAELGAMVSAVAKAKVLVDATGKIVYDNGTFGPEIGYKLRRLTEGTDLTADGTLRIINGDISGEFATAFEGSSVRSDMQVHFWGDEVGADLALATADDGDDPYFGVTGGFRLGDDDLVAHLGGDVSVGDVTVGVHSSLSVENTSTVTDGVRHVEHIRIRSAGGLVEVPVGHALLGAGFELGKSEKFQIACPVLDSRGEAVPTQRLDGWLDALRTDNPTALFTGVNGASIEHTVSTERHSKIKTGFGRRVGFRAGNIHAAVMATAAFASNIDSRDIVGVKLAYDLDDGSRANATTWKIDIKRIARAFQATVGVDLDLSVIADFIRADLLHDPRVIGLVARQIPKGILARLRKFVDELKFEISIGRTRQDSGFESLEFGTFKLDDDADRMALTELLVDYDPTAAIAVGKFVERRVKVASLEELRVALCLLGLKLLVSQIEDRSSTLREVPIGDGGLLQTKEVSAGITQRTRRLLEENNFSAKIIVSYETVHVQGQAPSVRDRGAFTVVEHKTNDKRFTEKEAELLEKIASSVGLEVRSCEQGQRRLLSGYGTGETKVRLVIQPSGHLKILQKSPEIARRDAIAAAAEIAETGLPPMESGDTFPPTGLQAVMALRSGHGAFERRFPGDRKSLLEALLDQRFTVAHSFGNRGWQTALRTLRGERGDTVSAADAAFFKTQTDDALQALLTKALAADVLLDWRFVDDNNTVTRPQDARFEFEQLYERLTARSLTTDDWISRQGDTMEALYQLPTMMQARESGEDLSAELMESLVETFLAAAKVNTPTIGPLGSSGTDRALAFYLGLIRGLEAQDALAMVEADFKHYSLTAVTEGVNLQDVIADSV